MGKNHRERICKQLECLVVEARKKGTANHYAIASLHSDIVAASVDHDETHKGDITQSTMQMM